MVSGYVKQFTNPDAMPIAIEILQEKTFEFIEE
jgi:hypothetical protein